MLVNHLPTRLKIGIGGYMGPSYSVELWDGRLLYVRCEYGYRNESVEEITPTRKQWLRFRAELDSIGVARWRRTYRDLGILDGTGWGLEIAYEDVEMLSSGDNAYPESDPLSDVPSAAFNRFLKAVSRLAGGRVFR